MKKFLKEFYFGNIIPNEGRVPGGPAYKKKSAEVVRLEDLMMSKLNEEGRDLFMSFQLAVLERNGIENIQLFTDAFRLGARMMLEVMDED